VDCVRGQHLVFHRRNDRAQRLRRCAHPVHHRGLGDVDAVPQVDPVLTVQRQVVPVFRRDDLRQQPRTGESLGDHARWQLRRRDAVFFVMRTRELGSHGLPDEERRRLVLQLLGDLLADLPLLLAAAATPALFLWNFELDALTRKVLGQAVRAALAALLPLDPLGFLVGRFCDVRRRRQLGLFAVEGQLGMVGEALAASPEDVPLELGEQIVQAIPVALDFLELVA
jgi:hypothetical protein